MQCDNATKTLTFSSSRYDKIALSNAKEKLRKINKKLPRRAETLIRTKHIPELSILTESHQQCLP